ncbi:MAG: hypothetical protein M0Q88_07035 [Bacilli bacterium]|nr:hypothetical protein [Bacilli bacterium]
MALSANDLTQAITSGVLALPILNDASGKTYGDVMTEDQKEKMKENISVYASKIINELVTKAEVQVTVANHTHDAGTLLIAPSGGGPCTGVTGTPTEGTGIETGKPQNNTGGIT